MALGTAMAKSLLPGDRRLERQARTVQLSSQRSPEELYIDLREDFVVSADLGADFVVHRFEQVVPFGAHAGSIGVYLGDHPTFHLSRMESPPPITKVPVTLLGHRGEWLRATMSSGAIKMETIVPVPGGDSPPLLAHVFLTGVDVAECERLIEMARTLRLDGAAREAQTGGRAAMASEEPRGIIDLCAAFFEADQWPCERVAKPPMVRSRYAGRNGNLDAWFQARPDDQQLMFYARAPLDVPPARRAAAAEFITRANYGMVIGNFELDMNDGEIRYKVSLDFGGLELNQRFLKSMAYAAVVAMDRYLPGIMKLLVSDIEPALAVREIEEGGSVDKAKRFEATLLLPALAEVAESSRLREDYVVEVVTGRSSDAADAKLLQTAAGAIGRSAGPSLLIKNRQLPPGLPPLAGRYLMTVFYERAGDEVYASPGVAFWMQFNGKVHVFTHRYDNAVARHRVEDVTREQVLNHILGSLDFYQLYALSPHPFPGYGA
jgi:hypothetical protein